MMHIVYVAKLAPHLGARRIHETGRRLVALGHRVTVVSAAVTPDQALRETIDGMDVVALPTAPKWLRRENAIGFFSTRMPFYLVAPAFLERHVDGIDIIVEDVAPLWSARLPKAAASLGVPLVYQIHNVYESAEGWIRGYGLKGLIGARKERLLRSDPSCDAIYSDALWTTESLAADVRVPVEWIPNGVDGRFFVPDSDAKDIEGPLRILNVGRLVELKNHQTLLKAVADSGIRFELRIVGSGPLEMKLGRLAQSLGVSEHVKIQTSLSRDELLRAYQEAHLMCLPSLFEGMPMAALEAMACGTPVAMSDIPAANGVIPPEIGWRLPATDPLAWADLLRNVFHARQLVHEMSDAVRQFAINTFDWDDCVAQEEALFERLISS